MEDTPTIMDKTAINKLRVYKNERFRIPFAAEKSVGLWVDRIGSSIDTKRPRRLRMLGMYAAVWIAAGEGEFLSKTTGALPVKAGDTMLVFPEEPSFYYPHGKWESAWIVWEGPEARRLEKLGYLSPARPVVKDTYRAVERAYSALSKIIDLEDRGSALERKHILLGLVLALFKAEHAEARRPETDAVIEDALAFLSQHCTDDIPVPELAARFSMSATHFRRLFKKYTGRTPREFTTALRISKAKALLSEGKSIKEAAGLVGYDDLFYFMRVFKKVAGLPPGQFVAVGG